MVAVVTHIYSGKKQTFRGAPDQVLNQLLVAFPWAKKARRLGSSYDPSKLSDVMTRINGAEALILEVEDA
jgi:hypothetical protein